MSKTIVIILIIFIIYQILLRLVRRYWKFPAPSFIGRFLDGPIRKIIQPSDKIVLGSGIKKGMTVLDMGCGSGTFITDVARELGKSGLVCGLDIEIKMLTQVINKLNKPENKDIKNVEVVQANAYSLPFSDESFDIIYMVAVFQEIPDKERALKEILRVLKQNGKLSISEFWGDPDFPLKSTTIRMVQKSKFTLDKVSGNLLNYTINFKKI